MATIGLTPVGSATLSENLDWMVLDKEARKTLAAIADENIRELVRDFYLDQRFRRDVFARDNRRLGCEERIGRLFASTFALARPVPEIRYRTATAAGSFVYDTPWARAIVEALAAGPRSLAETAPARGATDVLNNLLTLCAADDILPVEPGCAPVGELNRALCRRLGGPEEIRWLALPCGTARQLDGELLRLMRDGEEIDEEQFPGWRAFLAAHGLALDPDRQ
jgi:hypothetical protein